MNGDDLPGQLDVEGIEVEITITDHAETGETYHHQFLTTETKLEEGGLDDVVELETRMALEAALRNYLSLRRRGEL